MMAVCGIDVVALEVRRSRQHDIAERHALGHRDVDAGKEQVLAHQTLQHAVLVGMHDDGIVIVDNERAQRGRNVIVGQMSADVHDVERTRTRGHKVRPLQLRHRLGKAVTGSQHDAAGRIETAHQRRQRNRRPDTAATIAATLKAIARRDDEGVRIGHPASQRADIIGLDPALVGSLLQRPVVRPRHECIIAEDMLVDESTVMGADALQLHSEREGKQNVRARSRRDMEVGLLGDLGAQGIDDNEFATLPQTHANLAHEMQVCDRRVVAPDDRQFGVLGRLGTDARTRP